MRAFSERKKWTGFSEKVLTSCGLGKSIEVFDFLLSFDQCSRVLHADTLCMAAISGDLDLVKHMRELGCVWDMRFCWMAAINGQLHVIKWAREQINPCPWDSTTRRVSRYANQMEVLQYARNNGCPE